MKTYSVSWLRTGESNLLVSFDRNFIVSVRQWHIFFNNIFILRVFSVVLSIATVIIVLNVVALRKLTLSYFQYFSEHWYPFIFRSLLDTSKKNKPVTASTCILIGKVNCTAKLCAYCAFSHLLISYIRLMICWRTFDNWRCCNKLKENTLCNTNKHTAAF